MGAHRRRHFTSGLPKLSRFRGRWVSVAVAVVLAGAFATAAMTMRAAPRVATTAACAAVARTLAGIVGALATITPAVVHHRYPGSLRLGYRARSNIHRFARGETIGCVGR